MMFSSNLAAQAPSNDTRIVHILTLAKNTYIGHLVLETDESITIRTMDAGDVTIRKSEIQRIRDVRPEQIVNGEYWFENPQSTRYLFTPSAYGLKKGVGYYQNVWVFFNNINYGLTDNLSMGGGVFAGFLVGGFSPIWITPKLSVPIASEKFHLSVGALVLFLPEASTFESTGILYGMSTYGDRNNNISLGIGYGFIADEISSSPVVTLSGMRRLSRRSYFVTENYLIPVDGGHVIFSGGWRWTPNENIAVDFALLMSSDFGDEGTGTLPWLSVTIPLGNR